MYSLVNKICPGITPVTFGEFTKNSTRRTKSGFT